MKVLGECEVDSSARIDSPVTVIRGSRTYRFRPSGSGFIAKIQIISPVERPELFRSEISATPDAPTDWQMTVNTDSDLLDSIESDFQQLEGYMALFVGTTRIR